MLNSGSALGLVERSVMYGETDIDLGNASEPGPRYPGGGTNRFGLSSSSHATGFATGGLNLYRSQGIQLQGKKGSATTSTFEYQLGLWQGRSTNSLANSGNDHLMSLEGGLPPVGFCRLEGGRRCRGQRAFQARYPRVDLRQPDR